jgi:hypothetical protein
MKLGTEGPGSVEPMCLAIVSGQTDHNHLIHHEAVTAYVLSLAFWAQSAKWRFGPIVLSLQPVSGVFFQRQDVALRNRALSFLQRVRKYSPPKTNTPPKRCRICRSRHPSFDM